VIADPPFGGLRQITFAVASPYGTANTKLGAPGVFSGNLGAIVSKPMNATGTAIAAAPMSQRRLRAGPTTGALSSGTPVVISQ
jgi:hypothetical protein